MVKKDYGDSFSVDDIHKLREEHYERTKNLEPEKIINEINEKAEKFRKKLNKNNKRKKIAM